MFRRVSFLFFLLVLFFVSHAQLGCFLPIITPDYTVIISTDSGMLTFNYFETRNQSAIYSVGLKQIWEAENSDLNNAVAGSSLNLTDWSCELFNIIPVISNDTIQYVTIKAGHSERYSSLVLNASFNLGPVDFNNSVAVGLIDVNITGYNWINATETDTQLVLTWWVNYLYDQMPENDLGSQLKTKAGKTVDFMGAYFAVNTSAKNGNATVDVSLSLASKYWPKNTSAEQDIYVVYEHFDGTMPLFHDPQFGFGSGPGSNLLWIIIIVVVIIAILVIILIAVIGFVLVRRRRRSFDSF